VSRQPDDLYRTPHWLVDAVLAALPDGWWPAAGPLRVLDAGAGDGRLGRAVLHQWHHRSQVEVLDLVEHNERELASLREAFGSKSWVQVHAAELRAWAEAQVQTYDLIVTNPPFHAWDAWVRALLPLRRAALPPSGDGGVLLALGFANVLGGQTRAAWWRLNRPSALWISPRRPAFVEGCRQTDSRDAVWYAWRAVAGRPYGPLGDRVILRWLPTERP
jgi:SAM-dependent methyltransferase